MQPKLWLLLIAGVFAADTGSIAAHHSFASTYLEDQVIAIEGDLVDVVYRNPHSFIHLRAPDGSNHMRVWAVECSNRGQLRLQGDIEQTLKPGDHLVITGSPRSSSTTSKVSVLMRKNASSPVRAMTASYPSPSRPSWSAFATFSSSSTTRMRSRARSSADRLAGRSPGVPWELIIGRRDSTATRLSAGRWSACANAMRRHRAPGSR